MQPPDYDDDSQNPYRATFIDEKPVEAAEFFRAEPRYRKLTPGSVGRTSYAMFMLHKWQFVGLGFAQVIFIIGPAVAVVWLLAAVGYLQLWLLVIAPILIVLLAVFMIVVSISVSLRILRKEKMIFFSTPDDAARLARGIVHTLIYMTIWLGILVVSTIPEQWCVAWLRDNWITWDKYQLVLGACAALLLIVVWILILVFFLTRLFYGVHFIVDCDMSCLDAFRASWYHTHGNIRAVTLKKSGTVGHNLGLLAFMYLTGGVGLAGYCYCDTTVTYLMLTGQCELLEELPDEW